MLHRWQEPTEGLRTETDTAAERETRGVKWATPQFQKKAFSDAWLGFFGLQLPDDIFRKVNPSKICTHTLRGFSKAEDFSRHLVWLVPSI